MRLPKPLQFSVHGLSWIGRVVVGGVDEEDGHGDAL